MPLQLPHKAGQTVRHQVNHPGSTLYALTRVWMGELRLKDAQREGDIALMGAAALVKVFPEWMKLSVFAHA